VPRPLAGATVLVAGAGLAGLAAARDLSALGAHVTVIDARDRVGGRVWTIRDGFGEGQHAEAGGDMIDEAQNEIRDLCKEVGLKLTRILRGGFRFVRTDASGKLRIVSRDAYGTWERLAKCLGDEIRPYRLAEQRWDTPIATDLARRSVAQWLDEVRADEAKALLRREMLTLPDWAVGLPLASEEASCGYYTKSKTALLGGS